jgi:ketosteroid isomerase-like protein
VRDHEGVAGDEITPAEDPSTEQARAANAAFYEAFEALDIEAMAQVWERSDRASVTHPGWPIQRGWARVAASWETIFEHTPYIQFVLTDEVVNIVGDVAWVTVDENVLQARGSPDGGGTDTEELSATLTAATNVFVRDGDCWRLVAHHGSEVQSPGYGR